jgi:predicted helicase
MLILEFTDAETKYANFTEGFIKNYLEKINFETTPESILAYIYAVLHSPVYRKKYIEFLKTDFPAVPMTKEKEVFKKYAALGNKLIDYHLLKNLPKDNEIRVAGDIPDKDFIIEKIYHANGKLSVTTLENKTIIFEGVTFEIYNFEIGSYRPVEKWLKYRIKDRTTLNISDLEHLQKMITAIKNTVSIMQEINKLAEEYLK